MKSFLARGLRRRLACAKACVKSLLARSLSGLTIGSAAIDNFKIKISYINDDEIAATTVYAHVQRMPHARCNLMGKCTSKRV